MSDLPPFATALVGSFPHLDGAAISRRLIAACDVPVWPQSATPHLSREHVHAVHVRPARHRRG